MAGTRKQAGAVNKVGKGRPAAQSKSRKTAATLQEAAGKAVGKESKEITKLLVDSALCGDSNSAKLLASLTDKQPKAAEAGKKKRRWSLAEALAAEPEWTGDLAEGTETGSGEPAG